MNYRIFINSADGETFMNAVRHTAKEALKFLDHYDHEGSIVTFAIDAEDSEEICLALRTLAEREE